MIELHNPLVGAWKAAEYKAAESWADVEDELAAVRVKHVEETLRFLSGLDADNTDQQPIRLAVFCYEACVGPLRIREGLAKRAGRLCQEVFVSGGGDVACARLVLGAANRLPLRSLRAHPKSPEARKDIQAQAKCNIAR